MPFRSPFSFLAVVPSGWGEDRSYRNGIHEGIDLIVPVGTPVVSIAAGTVVTANTEPCDNAGQYVTVLHDDKKFRVTYMHFSRVDVRPKQHVSEGQQLGLSGRTGGAQNGPGCTFDPGTASHVHMTVRRLEAEAGPIKATVVSGYAAVPAEPWVPAKYTSKLTQRLASLGITPAAVGIGIAGVIGIGAAAWLGVRLYRRFRP